MNCPNCNNEITANKKFCKYCGYKLSIDDKLHGIQNYSSLEKPVFIKCGLIAITVLIMFLLISNS